MRINFASVSDDEAYHNLEIPVLSNAKPLRNLHHLAVRLCRSYGRVVWPWLSSTLQADMSHAVGLQSLSYELPHLQEIPVLGNAEALKHLCISVETLVCPMLSQVMKSFLGLESLVIKCAANNTLQMEAFDLRKSIHLTEVSFYGFAPNDVKLFTRMTPRLRQSHNVRSDEVDRGHLLMGRLEGI